MNNEYEIETNVRRRVRKLAHRRSVEQAKAQKAHREAYKAVYIKEPGYVWSKSGMVTVNGEPAVTLRRLKELTKQLEYRRTA